MQRSHLGASHGQVRLGAAHAAVIGAGGLGCPVLTYLACAGIGTISIFDEDVVSLTNLNRQFLYGIDDIGRSKVDCCAKHFVRHYNDVCVIAQKHKVHAQNIAHLVGAVDIIVDCVDCAETRFIVNDYAVAHNIPLVEGAVNELYGFCLLIDSAKDAQSACLRCITTPIRQEDSVSVMGTTTGVLGALQAQICIQALLGNTAYFHNKLFHYDGYSLECEVIHIQQNQNCILHHK